MKKLRAPSDKRRNPSTPGARTKTRIHEGATRLFSRNGYDGTSMRDLAKRVRLRPSSLYAHVKSKQELLFRIMEHLMNEVLARAHKALADNLEPPELIRRLVLTNVCQAGPQETALLQTELKNLAPRYRDQILRKQREYRDLWLRVLEDGMTCGMFELKDAKLVFMGIDGALVHIERWFNPAGPLTREQVGEVFVDWILRSLGCVRRVSNTVERGLVQ